MSEHAHHQMTAPAATWGMARQATLHCLTGCAIGEVLGMVIGTALGWPVLPTVVLAIVLAFFFGYLLTMRGVLRAGVDFRRAVRIALAADTASIAIMELVDNAVLVGIPGAMDAGLTSALFWGSLAFSLAVAFIVTVPFNKWMIGVVVAMPSSTRTIISRPLALAQPVSVPFTTARRGDGEIAATADPRTLAQWPCS